MEGKGPPPVQLHLGDHMVDVPGKQLIDEHPARVHVAAKARVLPQGQLLRHFLSCNAPSSRLRMHGLR